MSNQKGFTLIELIVGMMLFGVGIIAVFVVLNSGFATMSQARGQVTAINLAREGAETMFNLRDTNLRKRSGKRDLCGFNRKGLFAADIEECENEERLGFYYGGTGISYIPLMTPFGASEVPLMIPSTGGLEIGDGISSFDKRHELMLTSSGEFLSSIYFSGAATTNFCSEIDILGNLATTTVDCLPVKYSSAGRFYRTIKNVGVYTKTATVTGGNNMQCADGASNDLLSGNPCGSSTAKELRFCSEVQYIVDRAFRKVTMCSVITNFKE